MSVYCAFSEYRLVNLMHFSEFGIDFDEELSSYLASKVVGGQKVGDNASFLDQPSGPTVSQTSSATTSGAGSAVTGETCSATCPRDRF